MSPQKIGYSLIGTGDFPAAQILHVSGATRNQGLVNTTPPLRKPPGGFIPSIHPLNAAPDRPALSLL
jgi:hypothetical protein